MITSYQLFQIPYVQLLSWGVGMNKTWARRLWTHKIWTKKITFGKNVPNFQFQQLELLHHSRTKYSMTMHHAACIAMSKYYFGYDMTNHTVHMWTLSVGKGSEPKCRRQGVEQVTLRNFFKAGETDLVQSKSCYCKSVEMVLVLMQQNILSNITEKTPHFRQTTRYSGPDNLVEGYKLLYLKGY